MKLLHMPPSRCPTSRCPNMSSVAFMICLEDWDVEELGVPVVCLDNWMSHHDQEFLDIITATGALVWFLPPYSPQYNLASLWGMIGSAHWGGRDRFVTLSPSHLASLEQQPRTSGPRALTCCAVSPTHRRSSIQG